MNLLTSTYPSQQEGKVAKVITFIEGKSFRRMIKVFVEPESSEEHATEKAVTQLGAIYFQEDIKPVNCEINAENQSYCLN